MSVADRLIALRLPAAVAVLAGLLLWETLQPFFAGVRADWPRGRARLTHGLTNVACGIVNGLVIRFVFLAFWLRAMAWADTQNGGLLHWLLLPMWAEWTVALLLLDAWTYAWHRINHRLPFLWRFHRLHHADTHMDVTTANRFHLGEIALSSVARVPLLVMIGCRPEHLALYEVLLFAVVQFHHADIALAPALDRALRVVIVTPHLHKVHHSVVVAEQNANFSSLFSWWDRLARTMRVSSRLDHIVFGVNDGQTGSRPSS